MPTKHTSGARRDHFVLSLGITSPELLERIMTMCVDVDTKEKTRAVTDEEFIDIVLAIYEERDGKPTWRKPPLQLGPENINKP